MNRTVFLAIILTLLLQPGVCIAEDGHLHHEQDNHTEDSHGGLEDDHKEHGPAQEEHDHDSHAEESHGSHEDEDGYQTFVEISPEMAKKSGVTISQVKRDFITEELSLPGEISVNGNNLVHVVPRFPGTLKSVEKQIGEKVRAGDLLAKVQSNESLSIYEIRSEMDGTIVDKDSGAGEFVTSEKLIFTIANFDTVWVNTAIYTNQIGLIQEGQQVEVESKSNNLTQLGTIDYIRPTLSETTRTALARVVLPNGERKWFPGMFVKVKAKVSSPDKSLLIPSESVVFMDNKYVAFISGKSPDGHSGFEIVPIKIGKNNGETIEVLEGLKEGLSVASGNTYLLKAELGKGSAEQCH